MSHFKELVRAVTSRHCENIKRKYSYFFDTLNLNSFWHYRIDHSGHFSYFGTAREWSEYFAQMKYHLNYPYFRHPKFFRPGISFLKSIEDENFVRILNASRDRHNLCLPVLILNTTDKGIEGFGFTSNSDCPQQMGLLINEIQLLKQFCKVFQLENKSLFTALEDNTINLAEIMGQEFYNESSPVLPQLPKLQIIKKLDLRIKPNLTSREIEILKLMLTGLSANQIAIKLYRSKRTIEHHIERAKEKLNCHTKSELIKKIYDLELLQCLDI